MQKICKSSGLLLSQTLKRSAKKEDNAALVINKTFSIFHKIIC